MIINDNKIGLDDSSVRRSVFQLFIIVLSSVTTELFDFTSLPALHTQTQSICLLDTTAREHASVCFF